MLKDITAVQLLDGFRLKITFEDDVEGVVDIQKIVDFTGVFSPLADPEYFSQVTVDPELGTICWPNHADLDPDVLYSVVTNRPLPNYFKATKSL